MKASARWLNDYLDPPAMAAEQAELLTRAGFPVEESEVINLDGGETDTCNDYELTSNRGDCICHIGLARELAAVSGRKLILPEPKFKAGAKRAADSITVTNHEHDRCPLYTGRVIRGVTVKPSPQWLQDRLRAIGQIPRNNIVDATNFVLFEYGQPTHVFDLAKIKGNAIHIRLAKKSERFLPIGEGEKEIALSVDDLVIADAEDPVAIGGVKGGARSAVTSATRDILIEAATFDPVTVRNSSRRHRIASDSSYRYERGVHPGAVEPAAERLVQLLLELTGGALEAGVVADGAPIPKPRTCSMRPQRCRRLLGVEVEMQAMLGSLDRLDFQPRLAGDRIDCTVPVHRLDIEREADLIEEVARMYGLEQIAVEERISVRIAPPQPFIEARAAVYNALVGMGFIETVTHSLLDPAEAAPFLQRSETALIIDRERRDENALRPSVIPSLLHVRAFNENQGASGLRLFEHGSAFAWRNGGHREARVLGMVMDVNDREPDLRPMRGAIECIARVLVGGEADVQLRNDDTSAWLDPAARARIEIEGRDAGWIGLIADEVRASLDLEARVIAAEIDIEPLCAVYPPQREVQPLPAYPAIERDISAIVDEAAAWAEVREAVEGLALPMLEAVAFVTVYRGKQVGAGRKSLTLRLRFRSGDRTLTHDEVDPQVERAMAALRESFNAEIRT